MTTLNFLHFNDVYHVDLASQFKTKLSEYQEKYKPVTVFSGDFVGPSLLSTFTKGIHMVIFNVLTKMEIMECMNVDYGCFGNHEFDFGVERLYELTKKQSLFDNTKTSKIKWIMSNVNDKNNENPICGALKYDVIEEKGIKIGLISLVEDWLELAGVGKDGVYLDYEKEGNKLIQYLKYERKCTLIFGISHNLYRNNEKMTIALPDVDFWFGGHEHDFQYDPKYKYIVSGSDFEEFSLLSFHLENDKIIKIDLERVQIDKKDKKDENINEIIKKYQDNLNKTVKTVVGFSEIDLDLRKCSLRFRETPFGNLLADSAREYMKTDITLFIGGIVSSDKIWPKGDLTIEFVISVFPWEGICIAIELTGKEIIQAMENGVSWLPLEDGRFPIVSGITFEYDHTLPEFQRCSNFKILGKDIELEKIYTVTTTDFIGLGGEGFGMCEKAKRIVTAENGIPQIDLLMKIVKEKSPLNPKLDSRLKSLKINQ